MRQYLWWKKKHPDNNEIKYAPIHTAKSISGRDNLLVEQDTPITKSLSKHGISMGTRSYFTDDGNM